MSAFDVAAITAENFTEDPAGTMTGGDVGGDTQASPSLNRRFAIRADDGARFIVLDFYAFEAIDNPNGDVNDPGEPRGITIMVHVCVCTDPNEPGETEQRADVRFWSNQDTGKEDTVAGVVGRLTREDLLAALDYVNG